jgi:PAS domain S-box-containing protein
MKLPLRVLYLEDDLRDAELVQDTLEAEGITAQVRRVETETDFRAALDEGGFEIILADYTLPDFDGLSALKIAQQRSPEVPFIFVSGTLGEDVAIEALKTGATDYVVKTRLRRLVPSVTRALREARERTERREAEKALRCSEAYLAAAQRLSHTGSFGWDVSSGAIYWSEETFRIFAYDPATEPTMERVLERTHPDDRARVRQAMERAARERQGFDFEHRLLMPDGSVKYLRVVGRPSPEADSGHVELVGAMTDITERKRAEAERQGHLWLLESLHQVNQAMQGTNDLEQMMGEVLEAVRAIFGCDRAWLVYPCEPEAPAWRAVMEQTGPEFPGVFALGRELPVDPEVAAVFRTARACRGAVRFGPGYDLAVPAQLAERFSIQSIIALAVYPKRDKPYLFGLHQCAYPRMWTAREERLFEETGRRLADGLTSLLMFRTLRDSEAKLEEAQRLTHVGYWDHDLEADLLTWSEEAYRIFGLRPEEPIRTLEQVLERFHPDDRPRVREAVAEALQRGARYNVEHRLIRPNGEVRIVHSRGEVTRDPSGRPRRFFGTIQDITERKWAEQRLLAQHHITQLLAEAATLEEATPKLLQALCEGLAWDLGVLWRTDRQAGVLRCVAFWRSAAVEAPHFEAASRALAFQPGLGLPGRVWQSREPAYLADPAGEGNFPRAPMAVAEGLQAACAFPILLGGEVLGVIEFFSREMRPPDAELMNMMATIGSQIGQFIERKRAEEELRRSEAYLAQGERIGHTGSWGWQVATGSVYWSKEHFRIFGYDAQTTKPTHSLFMERLHPEDRFGFEALLNRAVRDQRDFDYDYRIVLPDGSIKFLRSVGHALVKPSGALEFIGTVMDISELKRAEEARAALAREREAFAQQRAAELAKANEALRGCLEVLASVPDLDDFLGQVMAAMTRQLGARSSTLRVRNFEHNTMALQIVFQDGRVLSPAEAHYPENWRNVPIDRKRAAEFLNPQAAARRVLDPQTPIPESQRAYLVGLGVKTVLIVPLSSGGQVHGRLTFRFGEEREFQPEELEIARALAIQASLAIQLTRLANAARQAAVLEERNQLAGEIHDSLAQFFTGISMQLGAAKEVLKRGNRQSLPSYLERAAELAQFGLAEARRSAFSLQPALLENSGLLATLQKLVERSNIPGRLRCQFHASGVPEERLSPPVRHELLRIAQEAISNAVRHAKPTVISVNVRCEPPNLVLEVTDNGSGIAKPQLAGGDGFGLSNMRARAESLGAQFEVQTTAGRGTSIVVRVPLP